LGLCHICGSLMHWFPYVSIKSVVLLNYISCVIYTIVIVLLFVILFHLSLHKHGRSTDFFLCVLHLWVSHALFPFVSMKYVVLHYCISCVVYNIMIILIFVIIFHLSLCWHGRSTDWFCAVSVGLSCTGSHLYLYNLWFYFAIYLV
jgi:hypothetical protein